ncbi:hypothetical protein BC628DRAFT_466696 [Trametes gibbosa]|nr:hypothetical protein BC628DRAFT_466696 [Trametes gibbosa]
MYSPGVQSWSCSKGPQRYTPHTYNAMPHLSTPCPCQARIALSASKPLGESSVPSLTGAAIAGGIIFGATFFTLLLWYLFCSRTSPGWFAAPLNVDDLSAFSSPPHRHRLSYYHLRALLWSYLFWPRRRHLSSPAPLSATVSRQLRSYSPPPPYENWGLPSYPETILLRDVVLQAQPVVTRTWSDGALQASQASDHSRSNLSSAAPVTLPVTLPVACSREVGGGEVTSAPFLLTTTVG